jgi:hypothetical protein
MICSMPILGKKPEGEEKILHERLLQFVAGAV